MPRFVILRHETPAEHERPTHFDLMLEWGPVLRTWFVLALPTAGVELSAVELAPHRLAYLEYQGEVAGGRGKVARVATGEYQLHESSPALVEVQLRGASISGILRLSRMDLESSRWKLLLIPDRQSAS